MTAPSTPLNLTSWYPPEQIKPDLGLAGPVDARGANWRGLTIPNLDLQGAQLCRADLCGADLTQCLLEGADLRLALYDCHTKVPQDFDLERSGAVGPGAKLNGAFLNNADLREVDLRGAVLMGAYLSGADLTGALLDGISLAGADLRRATLRGAMCRATRFGTSQLDMADLRGADLQEASLESVESIKGADFSFCKGLEPQQIVGLLGRSPQELDHWNPLTRGTARASLESLGAKS